MPSAVYLLLFPVGFPAALGSGDGNGQDIGSGFLQPVLKLLDSHRGRIIDYPVYLGGSAPAPVNRYYAGPPFQGGCTDIVSSDGKGRVCRSSCRKIGAGGHCQEQTCQEYSPEYAVVLHDHLRVDDVVPGQLAPVSSQQLRPTARALCRLPTE